LTKAGLIESFPTEFGTHPVSRNIRVPFSGFVGVDRRSGESLEVLATVAIGGVGADSGLSAGTRAGKFEV
jgi:hypothetical protein